VENRTWSTNYWGLLAIHAGSTLPRGMPKGWQALPLPNGETCGEAYVLSAVVAVVELVGVVTLADLPEAYREAPHEDFDPCGPWCWLVGQVWRLPAPYACKGKLSLWKVDLPAENLPSEITRCR
jgi:hypothetical protein